MELLELLVPRKALGFLTLWRRIILSLLSHRWLKTKDVHEDLLSGCSKCSISLLVEMLHSMGSSLLT